MTAQRAMRVSATDVAEGAATIRRRQLEWSWSSWIALLIAGDAVAICLAFVLAYEARFRVGIPLLQMPPHELSFYTALALWTVPSWLGLFAIYHLYDRRRLFAGFWEYTQVVNACTVGMVAVVLVGFMDSTLEVSRGWLLLTWLLAILFLGVWRFAVRRLLRRVRRSGQLLTTTIIVGANEEGRAIAEQLLDRESSGSLVVGFVDNDLDAGRRVLGDLDVLGNLGSLPRLVEEYGARDLVVATTALPREGLLDLYHAFGRDESVDLKLSSGLFEILTTGVQVQENSSVPLMVPQRVRITGVDAFLKATLDCVGAVGGLLVLGPAMLVIGLLVKLDSPGPVLHRRRVLGRNGRPFDALKFRTMVENADEVLARDPELRRAFEAGQKLKEDPRVTRVGRFLRRTSLDELPQLLNVLRGQMSIVGPRMIAPDEARLYGKWQLNLLTVKPGITGPWQVHGRNELAYEDRVKLSMHYIRNYSIWMDLEILLRTVWIVARRSGAY